MTIGGLMKLTLLDFPGKVACTVFTAGCNFRCPFCHNASLVKAECDIISEEEFFAFLRKRHGILDGVCVSGGEPTLHGDLIDFIAKIKEIGYSVKLDTNGSDPDKLKKLVSEGLVDYVAMDIKNSPSSYVKTCGGVDLLEKVMESIEFLRSADIKYEFRTTVAHGLHTDSDFHEIGLLIHDAPKYYLQTFKDSGDILAEGMSAASDGDMKRYLNIVKRYVPNAKLRGSDV
ncbi:MAG: anaerobic ribonucleoside-triphosphate reductase activating protein [Clostridia bacterium]|nr:anaerobic ribonucleoside-triphosphate reductase activating protein [Clostridia bacterium]